MMAMLGGLLSYLYKGLLGHGAAVTAVVTAVGTLFAAYEAAVPSVTNAMAAIGEVTESLSAAANVLKTGLQDNSWMTIFMYCCNWALVSQTILDMASILIVTITLSMAMATVVAIYAITSCGVRVTLRILKAATLSTVDLTT